MPAEHDMLKWRVALWGLVAIATSKEWYEYTTNQYCHKLGPFAWMTLYTVAIETASTIKFGREMFAIPTPSYVLAIWGVIAVAWTIGLVVAFRNGQMQNESVFNPYNPAIDVEGKKSK